MNCTTIFATMILGTNCDHKLIFMNCSRLVTVDTSLHDMTLTSGITIVVCASN